LNKTNIHPINNPDIKNIRAKAHTGIIITLSNGQNDIIVTFEFEIVKIERKIIKGTVRKKEIIL
jgi:hypothetical protein